MEKIKAQPQGRLKGSVIFLYTCAAVGFNMLWAVQSAFITYFYTQSVGIHVAVVGAIALGARLWDAINDPMMGSIADRTNTRMGRYRPYLLWGIAPLFLSSVLMFTSPSGASMAVRTVYAAVTYVLFGMSYTFINIPYMTMQSTLTPDPDERTRLINLKNIGVMIGSMVASVSVPMVTLKMGDRGYILMQAIFSTVMAAGCLMAFFGTKPYIANEFAEGRAHKKEKISLKKQFSVITSNRPLLLVMLIFLLITTLQGITAQVGLYYTEYYLARKDLISLFMFLGLGSGVISMLFIMIFGKKIEKRTFMLIGFIGSAVFSGLKYLVQPDGIGAAVALTVIAGVFSGFPMVFLFSMVADCVDYGAWKTGAKMGGTVFSTATFAQKTGGAVGAMAVGAILAAVGFVSGGGAQTAGTVEGIRVLSTFLPAGVSLVCALISFFYPLSKKKMREIGEDLKARAREQA